MAEKTQGAPNASHVIAHGQAVLGVELGSTRIKATLIEPAGTPLAAGSFGWENKLEDGVWTYHMQDVWSGLAACYANLVSDVRKRYGVSLSRVAAAGFSGMMHGYLALEQHHRPGFRGAHPAICLSNTAALEHCASIPGDPERRRSFGKACAYHDPCRIRALEMYW